MDERCPECGLVGGNVGEHHGQLIFRCYNGECRTHQYLVNEQPEEPEMTDDKAMVELVEIVERLNNRTVNIVVDTTCKESVKCGAKVVSKKLQKLTDYYSAKS